MKNPTIPKKARRSFILMTFLRMRNSGRLSPTTAIMKASPVPRGIHFAMRAWMIGRTLVALAYIGIPRMTAIGTAKGFDLVIYCSKNPVGMNPWMIHPMNTPIRIYGIIFQMSAKLSRLTTLKNVFHFLVSSRTSTGVPLFFQINSATSHSILNLPMIHPPSIPRITPEVT